MDAPSAMFWIDWNTAGAELHRALDVQYLELAGSCAAE